MELPVSLQRSEGFEADKGSEGHGLTPLSSSSTQAGSPTQADGADMGGVIDAKAFKLLKKHSADLVVAATAATTDSDTCNPNTTPLPNPLALGSHTTAILNSPSCPLIPSSSWSSSEENAMPPRRIPQTAKAAEKQLLPFTVLEAEYM